MAINWKVAAAGGVIAGLGVGGLTVANAGGSGGDSVDGVHLDEQTTATAPATAQATDTKSPAPRSADRSSASSVRSWTNKSTAPKQSTAPKKATTPKKSTAPKKKVRTYAPKSVKADPSNSPRSADTSWSPKSPNSPDSPDSPDSADSPDSSG